MNDLQRTEEWYLARKGKMTASKAGLLLSNNRKKDGFGQTGLTYINEVANQALMSDDAFLEWQDSFSYSTKAMQWGTDNEEFAIKAYMDKYGVKVEDAPFLPMPLFEKFAGGSPDGLVGEDGMIEVKCPVSGTAIAHAKMVDGIDLLEVNSDYYYQIQFNLLVTGRKWCDFISYVPMWPEDIRLKVVRVYPDQEVHDKLRERLLLASTMLQETIITIINNKN